MSPTVMKLEGFRFFFFSREEIRMHVHVLHADGEAKFWIEPTLELVRYTGLSERQLAKARRLIEENQDAIRNAWTEHFGS